MDFHGHLHINFMRKQFSTLRLFPRLFIVKTKNKKTKNTSLGAKDTSKGLGCQETPSLQSWAAAKPSEATDWQGR